MRTRVIVKMIEFSLETSQTVRKGQIKLQDNVYHTPSFFIHTTSGSVPHISAEVFDLIFPPGESRPALQVSIDTTHFFSDAVTGFQGDVAKFVGHPSSPVFLTVTDPLYYLRSGYNETAGVALWNRTGKKTLGIEDFEQIVKDYEPTMFQGLSDYDVYKDCSNKRFRKSTDRTLNYLKHTTENTTLSGMFATIESGWFSKSELEANRVLQSVLEKQDQISGFLIGGLVADPVRILKLAKNVGTAGIPLPATPTEINYNLVLQITSKLPPGKPRYVPGPFNLHQIAELVSLGVDLFDSSYISKLVYDCNILILDSLKEDFPLEFPAVPSEELPSKHETSDSVLENENQSLLLNIHDKKFADDFKPISSVCSCTTCRKFSRAYLFHLNSTSELLGPVLIMIHNLTAFNAYFRLLRLCMEQEKLDKLISILSSKFSTIDNT